MLLFKMVILMVMMVAAVMEGETNNPPPRPDPASPQRTQPVATTNLGVLYRIGRPHQTSLCMWLPLEFQLELSLYIAIGFS